jgi:VWFA-related protein
MSSHRFPGRMRSPGQARLVLLSLSLLLTAAQAQTPERKETEKGQDQDEVVRVRSNLVNVDVLVKDKKGKFISDLKAEDFTIFEDGIRQTVEFFDPPLLSNNKAPRPNATAQVMPPVSEEVPRNIISLVLDGQTTDLTNFKQVREGTLKYIQEQLSDTDTVAIFAVTNGLQLLQPFTQDKGKLIAAIERAYATFTSSKNLEQHDMTENIARLREELRASEGMPLGATGGSAAAQAMIAERVLKQFVKLRTALSLQQSRPIFAALAAICEGQRAIVGKKTLVLFSQGFVTPAVLDWQAQSTVDIANRANVAIYVIDSAGLKASAPAGSLFPSSRLEGISALTSQEQRIRSAGGDTVFDNARHEGVDREHDILYRISGDTGGKFLKGNNDIAQGLERINQEIRARYTLAYRSSNQNFDGTFRKVKIEIRRPETQIISRSGYYAIPPEVLIPFSPEHKKLLANVSEAEANPGLPIFVEISHFRAQEGLYTVPVSIELRSASMKFNRKGDRQGMQLDVLGVVRTAPEKILSRLGGYFDVSLTAEQYQSILTNNIFYRQDLQLAPGDYMIDLIVRDRLSGKTAAKREKVILTETGSEFATTSAVLSRYVEPASPQDLAESGDVFTHGKARIRPSPSRQFRVSDNLIIFLAVYNAANSPETGKPLVRITVKLMLDGKAATKPFDYVLTETERQPVPHLTFAEYIRLSDLAPGKYTASIEAKDMVTRKFVRQEASFVLTP